MCGVLTGGDSPAPSPLWDLRATAETVTLEDDLDLLLRQPLPSPGPLAQATETGVRHRGLLLRVQGLGGALFSDPLAMGVGAMQI